jgi:putative heme-binding domain-containing protein
MMHRVRSIRIRFGRPISLAASVVVMGVWLSAAPTRGQNLEQRLLAVPAAALAKEAAALGDAHRGAIVFHQPYMACSQCHSQRAADLRIGPDLTKSEPPASDSDLVDAVLRPSKAIKRGFETVTVVTVDGRVIQGILVERTAEAIVLRDVEKRFEPVRIASDQIDQQSINPQSIMAAGQVNVLASRQQFLDLIRYLMEIRDGGVERARELEPPPALYAAAPLPEYEKNIDHAGMIGGLDDAALERGAAIYGRVCANCHGTHDRPGSLPTSLRFATGKFKSGSDPYTMYQTLTRGFGMMVPQSWMVPEQKYDVIHYIREAARQRALARNGLRSQPGGNLRDRRRRNQFRLQGKRRPPRSGSRRRFTRQFLDAARF